MSAAIDHALAALGRDDAAPRFAVTLDAGGPAVRFGRGSLGEAGVFDRLARPVGLVASAGRLAGARAAGLDLGDAIVFADIQPHATDELIARASEALAGARAVVAIGGGSAIGIGKAVAAARGAELVAVATTYSGSELTMLYGVTRERTKAVRRDARALPRAVVYDPALTDDLPARAGAASLMNCLAHLLECGWNDAPDGPVRAIAHAGTRQIGGGLEACAAGDADAARDRLMAAGMCGGLALASGRIGLHHAICHAVGGLTGASHGEINGVVLPAAMRALAPRTEDAQEALVAPFRGDDAAPEPPHATVARLRDRWGLPSSLREVGLAASDMGSVVRQVQGHANSQGDLALTDAQLTTLLGETW
ncbi:iron-containing alcohol dehydrogenase [Conexibacter sp. CPCC 206217]|uniref:iron-containing alcohol dehydrogenase n=1 Tax=Conexibacter sp. CPCC 206217 TaxID=3064574 RepID=UPI002724C44A|nr:iron-containing alcohol dehydrogenase [Conexibacter sp. CPCC 206217]MDO8210113.1 iron-containing alcohol dehydrogenase [Conexibacter sp. CPCC 206217]